MIMRSTGTHVLKSSNVELQGRLQLDIASPPPGVAKAKGAKLITPQVRIVENSPEFAVMEITCSCGSKINVRCEYANSKPTTEQVK
jgi:hypothetical protein